MRSSNQVTVDLEAFREFMKKADLDEKQRRLLYGFLAGEMGYGGIRAVSQAFGVSHVTVRKGRSEIAALAVKNTEDGTARRIREPGGGRKSVVEKHPELLDALEALMRADASPGREPLLDWTTLSLRTVEKRFAGLGFYVTANTIGNTLRRLGFAMDGNRRMLPTPEARPDADEQFRFIRKKAERFLARKDPVISLGFKAPGDDVTGLSSLSVAPGARQDDTARLAECVERWWEPSAEASTAGTGSFTSSWARAASPASTCGRGEARSRRWPTEPDWRFTSPTCRPARGGGTASRTGGSAGKRPRGPGGRSLMNSSSASSVTARSKKTA